MKKITMLLLMLVLSSLTLTAGNEAVVGKWDCEAYVDMSYPFVLSLTEEAGKLAGMLIGDQGDIPLQSVSYEDTKLKFQFDYPEAGGLIDFEADVKEKSIEGTLGNDMFMGDFSCKPKK